MKLEGYVLDEEFLKMSLNIFKIKKMGKYLKYLFPKYSNY